MKKDLLNIGVAVIAVALTASAVTMMFLAGSVRLEVDRLAAANSDATQWSLAQTEVDVLALQIALADAVAQGDASALADVRRKFDILYSRVMTATNARQFAELRLEQGAEEALETLRGFLERRVSDFDGPDPALRSVLPEIQDDVEGLREVARSYSLLGVGFFAPSRTKDAKRSLCCWRASAC
ncbi:hypothetical protein ABMC89_15040 [Sulfitobacter sp. HNIBRBA3233]|uniref:hypothetical protein n=1 Tax=Sulfitobacter marinivivus TaxID=3158558 RepID=UPI0032DF7C5A